VAVLPLAGGSSGGAQRWRPRHGRGWPGGRRPGGTRARFRWPCCSTVWMPGCVTVTACRCGAARVAAAGSSRGAPGQRPRHQRACWAVPPRPAPRCPPQPMASGMLPTAPAFIAAILGQQAQLLPAARVVVQAAHVRMCLPVAGAGRPPAAISFAVHCLLFRCTCAVFRCCRRDAPQLPPPLPAASRSTADCKSPAPTSLLCGARPPARAGHGAASSRALLCCSLLAAAAAGACPRCDPGTSGGGGVGSASVAGGWSAAWPRWRGPSGCQAPGRQPSGCAVSRCACSWYQRGRAAAATPARAGGRRGSRRQQVLTFAAPPGRAAAA
jgi:hypothetical protein